MKFLSICTKFLHYLPTEISHWIALYSLKLLHFSGILGLIIANKNQIIQVDTDNFLELDKFKTFEQKVGFAAGLDKNGDFIDPLATLGVSFIELGTVTPVAQKGNSKPRLFRDKNNLALINRMGFNNKGVDHLIKKIKKRKSSIPLGISIGKNFNTPIEKAHIDYLSCLEKAYDYASYIAVNISSPNTANLRTLSEEENLDLLLSKLKEKHTELARDNKYKPILIKISPDERADRLHLICNMIKKYSIDGVICTNTSINHGYEIQGGLSGKLITNKSTNVLKEVRDILGNGFILIASGGVMSLADYEAKIDSGADLVQIYTGFIYEGPKLIQDILKS